MRCADVNNVCKTLDVVIKVMKVNHDSCLTFGKQRLQLLHGHSIVLGIVEHKVANLQKSKVKVQIDITLGNTYLKCNISLIKEV